MYLEHFGFREYPFAMTPDTEFFVAASCHSDALNVLLAALRSGEGFIAVTGEVGLGKTLMCRLLLRRLESSFATAYIPDPQLSPDALRRALADELGIAVGARPNDGRLMRRLREHLLDEARQGRRVVALLDEAHQLPVETLEAVRLLTNLETEKSKLLQVVLFGQPELDRRLADPSMRQLRQRIGYRCVLQPLDRAATGLYVSRRVVMAGYRSQRLFDPAAVDVLYSASRGTPRLINLLANKALMAAFGRGDDVVTAHHVQRAVADSRHAVAPVPGVWARFARCLTLRPPAAGGRAA